MSTRPTILAMQPLLKRLVGALEADYRVLRYWDAPAPADLAETRVMVVIGEAPLDKALIERLPNLGLVASVNAGYDGLDLPWLRARGLATTHAWDVNQEDVADHTIGAIVAIVRQLIAGDRTVREGRWSAQGKVFPPSLAGKRVGIVGLGGIGVAVARRCEVMRMPVAWWGPREKPGAAWPRAADLETLARDSDILVVACRAEESNRGLISRQVVEALGPDGLLVNVARGQVVDEDAVIAALKDGRLGAAALDVFVTEPTPPERWADVPNTLLTPHTAGATTAAAAAMMVQLKANLAAFFAGEPLKTPIKE
ncbi:MAG: NAD(P)-dependent oxidoreductase [Caulobacteraceae bacterium]